mgnify:CR=1 FL=1
MEMVGQHGRHHQADSGSHSRTGRIAAGGDDSGRIALEVDLDDLAGKRVDDPERAVRQPCRNQTVAATIGELFDQAA